METKHDTDLPQTQAMNSEIISGGGGSPRHNFLIPSPIPTRRTRTYSQSERASEGPNFKGKVKSFCRQKGHGFISPNEGGTKEGKETIFVHISDIEGEFVPKMDDDVTYKLCPIPPKMEKFQAVHVKITHLAEGTHERWDSPVSPK